MFCSLFPHRAVGAVGTMIQDSKRSNGYGRFTNYMLDLDGFKDLFFVDVKAKTIPWMSRTIKEESP